MQTLPRVRLLPPSRGSASVLFFSAASLCAAGLLLPGCASPGRPSPPSLQIPRIPADLTASRSGEVVELHWTTPSRTTDGIALTQPIVAEICRSTTPPAAQSTSTSPCSVVATLPVRPGPSAAKDTLPAPLSSGSPALLFYQVQLRGALGKSAGPSAPAFTASGAAPPVVAGLRATDTKSGALLQWTSEPAPDCSVELTRTVVTSAAASRPPRSPSVSDALSLRSASAAVTHLSAGVEDPGGTLDRTVEPGATYIYSAQRVTSVLFASRTVQLRSAPSAPVQLAVRSVFPPDPPARLVASPGPNSIDLSWEPDTEPHITGYRVYRAPGSGAPSGSDPWTLLTPELLPVPSYRDLAVSAGQTYRYRVTAVNSHGEESPPSNVATESPTQP